MYYVMNHKVINKTQKKLLLFPYFTDNKSEGASLDLEGLIEVNCLEQTLK